MSASDVHYKLKKEIEERREARPESIRNHAARHRRVTTQKVEPCKTKDLRLYTYSYFYTNDNTGLWPVLIHKIVGALK